MYTRKTTGLSAIYRAVRTQVVYSNALRANMKRLSEGQRHLLWEMDINIWRLSENRDTILSDLILNTLRSSCILYGQL